MKSILLIPLLAGAVFAAEPEINATLPANQIIFPIPDALPGISVVATFKSDKVVKETTEGVWIVSDHLVIYEVTTPADGYPHKELIFICKDRNPTPESGIAVKKVAWPFAAGSMTFTLTPKTGADRPAPFQIVRYQPVEPKKAP